MKKLIIVSIFIALAVQVTQAQLVGSRPNIIVILMDDMGYSDIGAFGGEVKTPNLDKLAKGGVKLSNMCNNAICVQTRKSLISGKSYFSSINKDSTLPAALRKADYHTLMVGKGHIGIPEELGFDKFFGFRGGASSYFKPLKDYYLDGIPFLNSDPDFYSTDAFTTKAIDYIKPSNLGDSKPFFLYLAYQAAHSPLSVPEEEIAKYRGIYLRGWKALSDERYQNQLKARLFPVSASSNPLPSNLPNWDGLTPEQRDLEDLRMSVYAAMIARADSGIGRLIEALDFNGQLNNTLILFMSDNGANGFPNNYLNQQNVNKGEIPNNTGTGWSYTSMTPFRSYKASNYSGGVKTGAIAYWPSKIQPSQFTNNPNGAINQSLLHIMDVMPTCLDLAFPVSNAVQRDQFKANTQGISFVSALTSENEIINRPIIFNQLSKNRSVRTNDWTMVENRRVFADPDKWELYRNTDFSESTNLAALNPAVVNDLNEKWKNWFGRKYPVGNGSTDATDEGEGKESYENPYIPISMPASLVTKKFGYMEAIGSDHLSPAAALSSPEKPNKPLATVFRGDAFQYVANGNAGIDGFAIPLELNSDATHRLVLKERIPARLRLDLFSSIAGEDFIFEYPNVPNDIKVYRGSPKDDNEGENFVAITKATSLDALNSSGSTMWYWENGTAYLKYKTPSNYMYSSAKGGKANVFFCLYNNCVDGLNKPVIISDFELLDTRGKLVPEPGLSTSTITNVDGKDNYTITRAGTADACVDYRLEMKLQNWEGVSALSIDIEGAKNSEVLLEDKSQTKPISLGTIAFNNGASSLTLPNNKNQLDQVKTIIIRTCENDFTGASKAIKINEIALGEVKVITSIEAKEEILSETLNISIYPNPSKDGVFNLSESANWEVVSILGEKLKAGEGATINLSGYPKGIYLFKINSKTEKIVIE